MYAAMDSGHSQSQASSEQADLNKLRLDVNLPRIPRAAYDSLDTLMPELVKHSTLSSRVTPNSLSRHGLKSVLLNLLASILELDRSRQIKILNRLECLKDLTIVQHAIDNNGTIPRGSSRLALAAVVATNGRITPTDTPSFLHKYLGDVEARFREDIALLEALEALCLLRARQVWCYEDSVMSQAAIRSHAVATLQEHHENVDRLQVCKVLMKAIIALQDGEIAKKKAEVVLMQLKIKKDTSRQRHEWIATLAKREAEDEELMQHALSCYEKELSDMEHSWSAPGKRRRLNTSTKGDSSQSRASALCYGRWWKWV